MEVDFDAHVIRVARNFATGYRCVYCDEIFHTEDEMVQHLRRPELDGGHLTGMHIMYNNLNGFLNAAHPPTTYNVEESIGRAISGELEESTGEKVAMNSEGEGDDPLCLSSSEKGNTRAMELTWPTGPPFKRSRYLKNVVEESTIVAYDMKPKPKVPQPFDSLLEDVVFEFLSSSEEMEPNFDKYLTRVAGDCGDKYRCLYCRAIFHTKDEMAQHFRFNLFCEAEMLIEYSEEQAALLKRLYSEEQEALLRPFIRRFYSYEHYRRSYSEEREALLRLWFSKEQAALLTAFVSNELLRCSFSEEQAVHFRRSTTAALFSRSISEEQTELLRCLFSEEQAEQVSLLFSKEQATLLRRLFSEKQVARLRRLFSEQAEQVAHLRRMFSEEHAEQVVFLRRLFCEEPSEELASLRCSFFEELVEQEILFKRLFSEELAALLRRSFSEEQAALLRRAISKEEMEVDFYRYVIQVARNRAIHYSCVHCRETYYVKRNMVDHLREAHMTEMRKSFSEEQALILEEQAAVRDMFF